MWLDINPRSSEPIYLQIIRGVKTAVARGFLLPGEKLPSVRELATELAINHNTVARAYQELEHDRIIEVMIGRGTFISIDPKPPNLDERKREMQNTIKTLLVEAHHLGLTTDQFLDMVRSELQDWTEMEDEHDNDKND